MWIHYMQHDEQKLINIPIYQFFRKQKRKEEKLANCGTG